MFTTPCPSPRLSVRRFALLLLLVLVCTTSFSTRVKAATPHNSTPQVIFDSDVDFDDVAAFAYLAQEHKLGHINLVAVTVTYAGASFRGRGIQRMRCLAEDFGLSSVPIADGPAIVPNRFPLALRFGVDFILSQAMPGCNQSLAPATVSAAELIARVITQTNAPITIITTGPLSNIAETVQNLGADVNRIRLIAMGGAVGVPGNLCCEALAAYNNTQELNSWGDPAAAQTALSAFPPDHITLIPLDATNAVPVRRDFIDELLASAQTPEAQQVVAIYNQALLAPSIDDGSRYWWDPLAAMVAVDRHVASYEQLKISVVQSGPDEGRTLITKKAPSIKVGIDADLAGFETCFLATLNASTHS
jgi:purine nucleosidase